VGDEPEFSPGGSEIRRHGEMRPPEPVPTGWAGQELIEDHVEDHVGPIETVYHELASEYVHLDVLIVEATEERPVHHLVTSGMSSRPMETEDAEERLAELVTVLPREWPLDEGRGATSATTGRSVRSRSSRGRRTSTPSRSAPASPRRSTRPVAAPPAASASACSS
jgi:hypothetical protein